jgi:hypothetical protein
MLKSLGQSPSSRSLRACTATTCTSAPVVNGCRGAVNCYAFNTSSGSSVCSAAPSCSSFDACTSNSYGCPSPNYVCVVNSCCSSPVCVPLSLIDMCSITTTTAATTTIPASSKNQWKN